MKTKNNFKGFFGIIMLSVVLVFALAGCGDDTGGSGGGGGNGPEMPSHLINTIWVHTEGHRVQFGANTVIVTPASGYPRSFTLKSSSTVSELNQTTLNFGDDQISDFIVYRDSTINTVSLGGVQKTGDWMKSISYLITFDPDGGNVTPTSKQVNSIYNLAGDLPVPTKTNCYFGGWYTYQNGGGSEFTSLTGVYGNITVYAKWTILEDIAKSIQLTEENWKAILTEIETAGKYVNLDLSDCTPSDENTGGGLLSNGNFAPIIDFSTGKSYIVTLILPNTATIIDNNGIYNQSVFYGFSNLKSVNASAVNSICIFAFYNCTSLASVSFPKATSIGSYAFAFTEGTALTITLGLTAPTLGDKMFSGAYSKTVTVKVPSGATGYGPIPRTYSGTDTSTSANWGNGFRGRGWTGTGFVSGTTTNDLNSNVTLNIMYQ